MRLPVIMLLFHLKKKGNVATYLLLSNFFVAMNEG